MIFTNPINMKKQKYRVIVKAIQSLEHQEKFLNEMYAKGWDLHSMDQIAAFQCYEKTFIFKAIEK